MILKDACCYYVAYLRALYAIHQNHHWLTKGKNFYGNHLLFQRIYESAQENADDAAEKIIGVFGEEGVSLEKQNECIYKIIKECNKGDDLLEISLKSESKFIEFSKSFYDELKKKDLLSLGLDDLIMSISSKREESVYLLKQALNGEKMKSSAKMKELVRKFTKNAQAEDFVKKAKEAAETALLGMGLGVFGTNIRYWDKNIECTVLVKKPNLPLSSNIKSKVMDAMKKALPSDFVVSVVVAESK